MAKPLAVGARVTVKDKEEEYGPGVLRFIGTTKFATGEWVGIELDNPTGKNDGSVKGDKYFSCKMNHGVFIKSSNVILWDAYMAEKTKKTPAAASPTPTAAAKKVASPTPAKATASPAKATAAAAATAPSAVPAPSVSPVPSSPETPEPTPTKVTNGSPSPQSPAQSAEEKQKLEEMVAAHAAEKAALEQKIESMSAEFSQKEKEYTSALDKLAVHLQALTTKKKELEAELEEYKVKSEDLASLLEEAALKEEVLKEEIETAAAQARKAASEEIRAALDQQVAAKQKEIDDLKAAVAAAGDSSAAMAELAESASKLASVRQEMESLKQSHEAAIEALKSQFQQERAQLEASHAESVSSVRSDMQKIIDGLHFQLENSASEASASSELQNKLDALTEELEASKNNVEEARKAAMAAGKLIESLKSELADVKAASSMSSAGAEEASKQIAELKATIVSRDESIAELTQIKSQQEQAMGEMKSKMARQETEISSLQASHNDAISSLEKKLQEVNNELAAASSGAGEAEKLLRTELAEKRSQYEKLEQELSQAHSEIQTSQEESERLKGELVIQKELMEDVELKLTDAQTRLGEAEMAHEEEVDRLEKQLKSTKQSVEELEKTVDELRGKLSEASAVPAPASVQVAPDDTEAVARLRQELEELKAKHEDQVANLSDQLEMATVDKELAEGQLEQIQAELTNTQQRVESLEHQLAESKGDSQMPAPAVAAEPITMSDTDSAALLQQNAQLTEALIKLREFAETTHAELQRLQVDVPNLELAKTTLEEKVLDYEDRLEALKESVEDARGLQDKFQELFEQKMDLEEENRSLKETLQDLQALRDLADETEENHLALEKRLQSELYTKQVEALDKDGVISNLNLVLDERAQTIERLERFLNEMQAIRQREIQEKTSQDESSPSEEQPSKESEELAALLRQQASREAMKALQDALHDLDMQQAILQNRMFRLFVPESAIKADQEASSLLLLMKRISFKSNLAVMNLHKQFSMDRFERNLDQVDAFLRFVWSLQQLIYRFEFNSAQIVDALRDCDDETYAKLSKLLYEVSPYEKKVDNVLALIQSEDIRIDQPPLDDLTITLDRFDFLCEKFVPRSFVNPARLAAHSIRSVLYNSRSIMYFVKQSLGPLPAASAFGVSDDRFKMLQDLARKVGRLLISSSTQSAVDYQLREIEPLSPEVSDQLTLSSRLIGFLLSASETAAQQLSKLSAQDPSKFASNQVLGNTFEDLIREALSKTEQMNEVFAAASQTCAARASHIASAPRDPICVFDKYYDIVYKLLAIFEEELSRGVYDAVSVAGSASAPTTPIKMRPSDNTPPALTPSKRVGDSLAEASLGVCSRLEEHAFNIRRDLESTLDIKNSTATIHKELAERDAVILQRSKVIEDLEWKVKKIEHRATQLERELEETTTKSESERQKALTREKTQEEQLHAQTRQLESANGSIKQLQDQLRKLEAENQALQQSAGSKQQEQVSAVSSEQASVLKEAIMYLTEENQRLRTLQDKQRLLRDLPPLVPSKPASALLTSSLESRKAMVASLNETLSASSVDKISSERSASAPSAAKKVSQALGAIASTIALPRVVDLSSPRVSAVDQLKTISLQHRRLRAAVSQVQSEAVDVLLSGKHVSREVLTRQIKTASEASKLFTGQLPESPLARVSLPQLQSLPRQDNLKVAVNREDFENLHQSLLRIQPIQ